MCNGYGGGELMEQKYTREEYEVILNYDYIAGQWTAWTNIPAYINKFRKQGWSVRREDKYDDGSVCSVTFTAPKPSVSIGKAVRPKRNLSDLQRLELRKRATAMRGEQILDQTN